MRKSLIILSGNLCAGKTTVARYLAAENVYVHIKTRELLKEYSNAGIRTFQTERELLVQKAADLDNKLDQSWIYSCVKKKHLLSSHLIIDSLRSLRQLENVQQDFRPTHTVLHIHLKCDPVILRQRYLFRNENKRQLEQEIAGDFEKAMQRSVEKDADQLMKKADLVFDSASFPEQMLHPMVKTVIAICS